MLQHEHDIKSHTHVPQPELDRVPRDAAPIALQFRINDQLHDTQHPTHEIQQDLRDAPSHGGFMLVVGVHLRHILNEGDEQLDITNGVDDVDPRPARRIITGPRPRSDEQAHEHNGQDAADRESPNDPTDVLCTLGEAPYALGELAPAEGTHDDGVEGEDDVVQADGGLGRGGVADGVLAADHGGGVEGEGGDEVGDEAEDVDEGECGGGAGGGAAAEVEDGLRVEGEGPCCCAVGGIY